MAGYLLHIEGIKELICTHAYTINVATAWFGYTALGCIDSIGDATYSLDPIKREVKVGDLSINCKDDSSDTLTTLFGWRATAGRMFLDATIQEGDAMAGAGVITCDAVEAGIAPLTVFIEGESFYCATQAGVTLTGVTREKWGSTAGYHQGYTGEDGYRPQVTTFPQSWANRKATLYRIDSGDLDSNGQLNAQGTQIWAGPLLQVTPSGLGSWKIKIGSVMRMLAAEVFDSPSLQKVAKKYSTADDTDSSHYIHLAPQIEIVQEGLTTTALGSSTTAICSTFGEPDGHWNSQYALYFEDSGLVGYYASIESWDLGTTTFTIAKMPIAVPNGTAFKIVRWNNYTPKDEPASWVTVVVAGQTAAMRWTPPTSSQLTGSDGLTQYWKLRAGPGGFSDADVNDNVREVFTNVYREGDGVEKDPWTYVHPLTWLLQMMLSTGDGTAATPGWNHSTYDVLARTHAAAIPAAWVDVSGIETIRDECPATSELRFAYNEPTSLIDIIEEMCALLGLYPAINSTGQITLRRMEAASYGVTADATLTEAHVTGKPVVTQNHAGIVRGIKYAFNFLPYDDSFKASTLVQWQETNRLYGQSKIDDQKIHLWVGHGASDENVVGNLNAAAQNISDDYLLPSAKRLLQRLGHPAHTVKIVVPLVNVDGDVGEGIEPGNLVALTHGQIPLPDGTRGCSSTLFELREAVKDWKNNRATLTLYWLPYLGRGARWAPAAVVTAWGSPNLTVSDALFPSGETAEDRFEDSSGTVVSEIRIHYCGGMAGGRYGVTEELAVTSVAGNAFVINVASTPVTHAPIAGDVVTFADYDTHKGTDDWCLNYAFQCEANDAEIIGDETVGAADDTGYTYQ